MKTYRIRNRKKNSLSKNILLWVCILWLFPVCLFLSTFFIPITLQEKPYSNVLYDAHGEEIGELIKDNAYRHRKGRIEDIPAFIKEAIITLEDKNFYVHRGVDLKGIWRALFNNISNTQTPQGASTLDTQVIRNMFWLNEKRAYKIKLKEFYYALVLNAHYTKDQILEYYLWNISFGYLNYGISSASHYYFWKNLEDLTKAEQIALLVLPKNPKKYDPYVSKDAFKTRFLSIAQTLLENKNITLT
jgi:membrane peptidoglycan carboxypeptidase